MTNAWTDIKNTDLVIVMAATPPRRIHVVSSG